MKKKQITTKDRIKLINNMLTLVQTKINELQKVQKDLIRDVELMKKELEVENFYD